MSKALEALNQKMKKRGGALQETVNALPCLSNDSLTEAEATVACEALAPLIGEGSHILTLIRDSVSKPKPKSKKKPKLKAVKKSDED